VATTGGICGDMVRDLMAESFVKTFKRDYVQMNLLHDARTTMEQLPKWFEDYNDNHPHKGLKMKSPREFRRQNLS
jgi:putative transposase